MSGAAQAQLAASQAATSSQAEAAKNALDFAKQVYGEQVSSRAPYKTAGAAGLQEWVNLLGLQPMAGRVGAQGGGSSLGGGAGAGGTGRATATPNAPISSVNRFVASSFDPNAPPGIVEPTAPSTVQMTGPPGTGTGGIGSTTSGSAVPMPTTSTGAGVYMQAPDGSTRFVPPSLAPFFQAQGYTVLNG